MTSHAAEIHGSTRETNPQPRDGEMAIRGDSAGDGGSAAGSRIAEAQELAGSAAPASRRQSAATFLLAPVLQASGPLVIIPMQLAVLGADRYGEVALAQAWMVTAGVVAPLGLVDAIMRRTLTKNGLAAGRSLAFAVPLLSLPVILIIMLVVSGLHVVIPGWSVRAPLFGCVAGLANASILGTQQYARARGNAVAFLLTVFFVAVGAPIFGCGAASRVNPGLYLPAWAGALCLAALSAQCMDRMPRLGIRATAADSGARNQARDAHPATRSGRHLGSNSGSNRPGGCQGLPNGCGISDRLHNWYFANRCPCRHEYQLGARSVR